MFKESLVAVLAIGFVSGKICWVCLQSRSLWNTVISTANVLVTASAFPPWFCWLCKSQLCCYGWSKVEADPLCRRHHTYCVRHHTWHMYAIICVIQDIISTLYDNLYYLWHHMHYIQYITRIIYDISSILYDVTFTMCVTLHNESIYDIKHYLFMIYSLGMASHTSVMTTHPLCAFTATMPVITLSVFLTLLHRASKGWRSHLLFLFRLEEFFLAGKLPPGAEQYQHGGWTDADQMKLFSF